MIRRLRPFFAAARRDALAGGILLIAAATAEVLQPWPIKWLVDYVFGSATPPAWLPDVRAHADERTAVSSRFGLVGGFPFEQFAER